MDLGRSFDSFQHGAQEFFHRLSEIGWPAMAIALVFYLAHLLARSRAWQNVLRAAYPGPQGAVFAGSRPPTWSAPG